MGRLIDVDELNAKLRNTFEHEKDAINSVWRLNTLIDKVDEIPTAYDQDKVVEQLEDRKNLMLETFKISESDIDRGRIYGMDKAIEIVKGGGVNGN